VITGECVDAQGWRFEVVDLDGRRIDKLIATRLPGRTEKPCTDNQCDALTS
jgi:magnesium and cobalt exporter, CNNM family